MADLPPFLSPKARSGGGGLGRLGRRLLLRFVLFAALSVLVMIGMGVYDAWREIQDVRLRQQQIARWARDSLDSWFFACSQNLRATAAFPRLLDLPPETQDAILEQTILRTPGFRYVLLADARPGREGREVRRLYLGEKIGSSYDKDLSSAEWFRQALALDSYFSAVSYQTGVPTIVISRVIFSGADRVGVIMAELDLTSAYHLLRNFRDEERGSYVYVVNQLGQPVVAEHLPLSAAWEMRQDVDGIRAAVQATRMPLLYHGLTQTRAETWVIGAYARLQSLNWVLIAEQPLSWVLQNLLPLLGAAAGFVLLSAALAAVVGVLIYRQVARPVVQLHEGARRIGAGELGHRIDLPGCFELTALAEEFNRMASSLQQSIARQEAWNRELEQRVAERTRELSEAFERLRAEAEAREQLLRLVRQMSSPVIPVMEDVIVMPIVGTLDSERARQVMDDLLAGIERERARVAILDITGLAVVDTAVANALLQAARAARLLGAEPILVGISPEVAETVVHLGVEMRDLRTAATLEEGLRAGLRLLHRRVVPA
ncbi:MAG: STAS domain-containing protein [Chloroflexia bacterium]